VLGEGRESHPPLFGLAIVGPPVGRVGAQAGLPPGPTPSRAHDHRPPPHASWGYGFAPSRGGDSRPLSHAQPSGFAPRTLSASPNRQTPSPLGYGVRSKEGVPSSAAFGAAPARTSPGTRLTRQRGEVAASRPHVRPRHHPGSGSAPTLPRWPGRVKALRLRNLNKASPIPLHSLQPRTFTGLPTTRSQPRQSGTRPLPLQAIPPGHLPRSTPLER
jgi:hypothetical protein